MDQKTISFYTLGCRLNQSETAVIQNTFAQKGHRIVDFNTPADIVVVNTCTVTENGDADTRRLVYKINRISPNARIALIGCQAQVQREKLTTLPNVHWVIGNARKMDLAVLMEQQTTPSLPQVITPAISRKAFTIPAVGIDSRHTRANIKIQDGCDFFCSFCEIPYARGRARSRQFNDILTEAQALAAAGHKELVITGINVGMYQNQRKTICDVIEALEQIDGLERIRISSIEPTTIPMPLIKKMAQKTKLCRYLHIPLQSGSEKILKAMGRKYTRRKFADFIQRIFTMVPQICLGTDLIVGFPGETGQDFQETVEYFRTSPLHYAHVFSYSRRHMAKSRKFTDAVALPVIQQRSQTLRQLSQRKRRMFFESLVGTVQTVLFEQRKGDHWMGLTDNYVRIAVKSQENLANQRRPVELQHAHDRHVTGVVTAEK